MDTRRNMTKITKKGRHSDTVTVDSWLDSLGLYRKNVAYDETCLFRAVSEQLLNCQIHHERIRKECIAYARHNYEEFSTLEVDPEYWEEHLDLLEKHMVVCGNIEINIISKRYRHDVVVFDGSRQDMCNVTNHNFSSLLLLCLMDEGHYDAVYKREQIVTAGFCQSIVYKILYEEVFKISNVDGIVKAMLYEKNNIISHAGLFTEKKTDTETEINNNETTLATVTEETAEQIEAVTSVINNMAPFPFKVAKALDPTIYRNIEYDSWGEVRREMRLGEWYYGDDKLILGTRCILNNKTTNETYDCYIQDIIKDQNKCVVYLTKLAEKRTVDYSDLSPESDAKPWPLPYRFSKNLVIAATSQVPVVEKTTRNSKKRYKDKKRAKSSNENSAITTSPTPSEAVENVSAYVGVPLQMHSPSEVDYHETEVSTATNTESVATIEQVPTPEVQSSPIRYQWEQTPWYPHFMPNGDTMVWPQTPTTPQAMFNYNVKPMMASAPVTPEVIPYNDSNFPFYYNCHVDAYHQPFTSPTIQLTPNHKQEAATPYDTRISAAQNNVNLNYSNERGENENFRDQSTAVVTSMPERSTICASLTPQSTPVEIYSPMITYPPPTPVVYGPPLQDMTEMIVTSPPVIYTTPFDMQYPSPTAYVYPSTSPVTWYPAGVNSQGFIFPTRPQ